MSTRNALLRLALASLDEAVGPDVPGARALVRAALELEHEPERERAKALPKFTTPAGFGVLVQATARTVRRWIACGRIPQHAVTGSGRGLRVEVEPAFKGLRNPAPTAELAGAIHVSRRRGLKVAGI